MVIEMGNSRTDGVGSFGLGQTILGVVREARGNILPLDEEEDIAVVGLVSSV